MSLKKILLVVFLFAGLNGFSQVDYTDHWAAKHWTQRAAHKLDSMEYDSAIAYSVRAIGYDSTSHGAYKHLSYACTQTGDFKTLQTQFELAVQVFPDDDEFWYYLGNAHKGQEHWSEAIAAYQKAIDLSTVNGEDFALIDSYYLNQGVCYMRKKDHPKAIAAFTALLERTPAHTGALTNRGICHHLTKNKAKACADWEAAQAAGSAATRGFLDKHCR